MRSNVFVYNIYPTAQVKYSGYIVCPSAIIFHTKQWLSKARGMFTKLLLSKQWKWSYLTHRNMQHKILHKHSDTYIQYLLSVLYWLCRSIYGVINWCYLVGHDWGTLFMHELVSCWGLLYIYQNGIIRTRERLRENGITVHLLSGSLLSHRCSILIVKLLCDKGIDYTSFTYSTKTSTDYTLYNSLINTEITTI